MPYKPGDRVILQTVPGGTKGFESGDEVIISGGLRQRMMKMHDGVARMAWCYTVTRDGSVHYGILEEQATLSPSREPVCQWMDIPFWHQILGPRKKNPTPP